MALTPKRRNVSFSLSASLSLFSALTLSSHAHLWSLKLSLKMRVSSNELFSTLKKIKCFCIFLERVYHFQVAKKVKIGENDPNSIAFKLKTGLVTDNLFVSSASRIYELRNFALDFLNLLLK